MSIRKTPLFHQHEKLGARMIDFGGWHMPISYQGVLSEHEAVRNKAGMFDVSHMGEILVRGKDALKFLDTMMMNDPKRLKLGDGQYTGILNPQGGFIDDLIVYRIGEEDYFICANAANIEKDFAWLCEHKKNYQIEIENQSDHFAQLALQGPLSPQMMSELLSHSSSIDNTLDQLDYTQIMRIDYQGADVLLARTGYTGERGYECYIPASVVENLWIDLLELGAIPCGLGARDTLRLESCYLLYGNDMDETINPLEVGVGWAVKLPQREFIGSSSLKAFSVQTKKRKLFAFKMDEQGIPRHNMDVLNLKGDKKIGLVSSGSVLPSLGGAGGMMLIEDSGFQFGDQVQVDVRGKTKLASLHKRPLYQPRVR